MSEASARFGLPWLQPGQAQKEMFHNEALAILDGALHPAVEAMAAETPPADPTLGSCWGLGAAPTEAWAGQGGRLACWTEGGWRFVAPTEGMAIWSIPDQLSARWLAGAWALGAIAAASVRVGGVQVVGARGDAIADPAGGATVDTAARAAITALLAAVRGHGLIAS